MITFLRTDDHVIRFIDINRAFEQVHVANEACHEQATWRFVYLVRLSDLQKTAFLHHCDPVSHDHGFFLIVRYHDAGDAHLLDDIYQFELCLLTQLAIQRAERFIEQQQLGAFCKAARQSDTLLLSAGKLMRLALGIGFEFDDAQHRFYALGNLVFGHAVALETEGDIFPHGKVRKKCIGLEHHVDWPLVRRHLRNIGSIEKNIA